ncbi:MAG: caspase family protein, partial [Gemmatimonadaceae bacterium]|nr:caspase family protein [Gemmatimonadaceae bacterium]
DELALKLEALAEKTRYLTLIFDSCHSGTITRDGTGPAGRSTRADTRPAEQLGRPPVPLPANRSTAAGPSGWLSITERYVLIAGCRDDEESKEYYPPELGGTVTHGALTWFMVQALRAATPGTTYRDVFERVASQVNAANRAQHPQMEGKADREIFGVREFVPARYLRITAREGDLLTLGAGLAQGVTVGSRFAICAPGTKAAADASPLGHAEITNVSVATAQAQLVDEAEPDSITVDARAFETQHAFGGFHITVAVDPAAGEAGVALREVLADSTLVAMTEQQGAGVLRAVWIPARAVVGPHDPVPRAGPLATPMWAVLEESGDLVMPLKPASEARTIRENLETIARYRQALALENPDANSALRGKFFLELLTRRASGEWVVAEPDVAGGHVVYTEGDPIGFRLRSTHDTPVFFSLIDFEPTGAITPLRPDARARDAQLKLAEHQKVNIGPEMSQVPTVTWPKGFPFVQTVDHANEVECLETVKLFITEQPADFSVLQQPPVRSGEVKQRSALSDLLHSAFQGRRTRGVAMGPAQEDWTTVQRTFVVRRRSTVPLSATVKAVEVGGATLVAPGVSGTAEAWMGKKGRTEASAQIASSLHQALADASIDVQRSIGISGAAASGPGSRGGAPTLTLTVPAPPPGCGQLVMATDADGLVTWHVSAPRAASRGGTSAADARRYTLPISVDDAPSGARSRGLVAVVGKKLLKELVFPLIDPIVGEVTATFVNRLETAKWPYRVREFAPGAHALEAAAPFDAAAWHRMSTGRALLFVHGTFSRAHLAFGALPDGVMTELHRRYEGRVFAFDHFTLSHDPKENIRQFLAAMPDGSALDCDIVCHSRGGLVARMLSEQLSAFAVGARRVRVGQVVFVGSPNAGTGLADPQHVGAMLDLITNLVNILPSAGVGDVLGMVLAVLKQLAVGAMGGLDGLMSMDPDGTFATWMRDGRPGPGTRYRAIASNVTPADPGLRRLLLRHGLDRLVAGVNDLVVPTESVYGAAAGAGFPIAEPLVLSGDEGVSHTRYFGDPLVQQQLLT